VVVLLQDGHELVDGESAAHFQFCEVAVQPIEDARVVAADEEDLVALQFQVAVEGTGQQLHGGDQDPRRRLQRDLGASIAESEDSGHWPTLFRSLKD